MSVENNILKVTGDGTASNPRVYKIIPSLANKTKPTGTSNKFGVATHDYDGAAADWVLTRNEANCGILIVTNAGSAVNIICAE